MFVFLGITKLRCVSVFYFWATVCKTLRAMLVVGGLFVLSVCLSVTLVYCGQTVGWIKMKLGIEVGLGPGHIVLDGDLSPPKKGHSPQFLTHVSCGQAAGLMKMPLGMVLAQATLCQLGIQLPHPKKVAHPPIFGPCLLWLNGWIEQDGAWYGGCCLGPGDIVLDGDPAPPPQKKKRKGAQPPIFAPCLL